jgi:aldose 1-epimerase
MPHYNLHLATDAVGLQVYAGAGLPDVTAQDTNGWPVRACSGLALEPQFWPDAPNQTGFPPIQLEQDTLWSQSIDYVFEF